MNELKTEAQYHHYEAIMGRFAMRLPCILYFIGFLAMMLGLVLFLHITYGFQMAACCVTGCALLLPVLIFSLNKMTWALCVVHATAKKVEETAGEVIPLTADQVWAGSVWRPQPSIDQRRSLRERGPNRARGHTRNRRCTQSWSFTSRRTTGCWSA